MTITAVQTADRAWIATSSNVRRSARRARARSPEALASSASAGSTGGDESHSRRGQRARAARSGIEDPGVEPTSEQNRSCARTSTSLSVRRDQPARWPPDSGTTPALHQRGSGSTAAACARYWIRKSRPNADRLPSSKSKYAGLVPGYSQSPLRQHG